MTPAVLKIMAINRVKRDAAIATLDPHTWKNPSDYGGFSPGGVMTWTIAKTFGLAAA